MHFGSSRLPTRWYRTAFAASVFINNHFVATTSGGTGSEQTNALYTFAKGSVNIGRDNVITVVQVSDGNSASYAFL